MLASRDALDPDSRRRWSELVGQRLFALEEFSRSSMVLFYFSFRSEVDTRQLIEQAMAQGRTVCLPRSLVTEKELEVYQVDDLESQVAAGAYGIQEPVPGRARLVDPSSLELVLVPGSAFDLRCGRLGYGGGYYDRFLSTRASQALRVGLAYSVQVVERLPLLPHDQPLDLLITEKEVIRCPGRSA